MRNRSPDQRNGRRSGKGFPCIRSPAPSNWCLSILLSHNINVDYWINREIANLLKNVIQHDLE